MNSPLHIRLQESTAVIFDFYHTLTGAHTAWFQGPTTGDDLGVGRETWNHQLLECSRERLVGEWTDPLDIVRRLAHAIDPTIPEQLVVRATENRVRRFTAAMIDIPPETIGRLHALRGAGKKLGLISNADAMEAQAWHQSPLVPLFDSALFSCHVGWAKPDREIFAHCLDALAVAPEQCVYVGDGGSRELEVAQSFGMTTVMVTGIIQSLWPKEIPARRAHADYEVEWVKELGLDAQSDG